MGQAKQRKAEIDALKARLTTVRIFAIRHCENGEKEFAHGEVSLGKPVNDKTALLRRICMNDWLHNPPMDEIAEYLIQSNSYKTFSAFGTNTAHGFVINFYEVDEEFSRKTGEKTYSCRAIIGMPKNKLDDYAYKFADELKATGEYSVKDYA